MITATSDELNRHHAEVASLGRGVFGGECAVKLIDVDRRNKRESYALRGAPSLTDIAQRGRGGPVPVILAVPGAKVEYRAHAEWLAYSEQWSTIDPQRKQLARVSVVLFWGRYQDPQKKQVIRADWDAPDIQGAAGQPHWHVDATMVFDWSGAAPDPEAEAEVEQLGDISGIEDLAGPRIQEVDIAGLHLPMSGWTNPVTVQHGTYDPACWQTKLKEAKELRVWIDRVFRLLTAEIRRVRPGPVITA